MLATLLTVAEMTRGSGILRRLTGIAGFSALRSNTTKYTAATIGPFWGRRPTGERWGVTMFSARIHHTSGKLRTGLLIGAAAALSLFAATGAQAQNCDISGTTASPQLALIDRKRK